MTQEKIAATIAYSMDALTYEQRMAVAEAFANDLRLKGTRRQSFIVKCHKFSELNRRVIGNDGRDYGIGQ